MPREPKPLVFVAAIEGEDPLAFLLRIQNDPAVPVADRVSAAKTALQYMRAKKGDVGKKAARQEAAEQVSQGRFKPSAAPKLRAVGK